MRAGQSWDAAQRRAEQVVEGGHAAPLIRCGLNLGWPRRGTQRKFTSLQSDGSPLMCSAIWPGGRGPTNASNSELFALLWENFSETAGTITVCGKIARIDGVGLRRLDSGKTAAAERTVALPRFAITALLERRQRPFWGEHRLIFPSSAATCRDPIAFDKQWRKVRGTLGVPDVTSHSFRKSVATLIDEAGLSARVGADQLGHSKVSMTQDKYMSRNRVHAEVAALLDRHINGE